jgi:hypothetical protein
MHARCYLEPSPKFIVIIKLAQFFRDQLINCGLECAKGQWFLSFLPSLPPVFSRIIRFTRIVWSKHELASQFESVFLLLPVTGISIEYSARCTAAQNILDIHHVLAADRGSTPCARTDKGPICFGDFVESWECCEPR